MNKEDESPFVQIHVQLSDLIIGCNETGEQYNLLTPEEAYGLSLVIQGFLDGLCVLVDTQRGGAETAVALRKYFTVYPQDFAKFPLLTTVYAYLENHTKCGEKLKAVVGNKYPIAGVVAQLVNNLIDSLAKQAQANDHANN
jgi:hypothetical protein